MSCIELILPPKAKMSYIPVALHVVKFWLNESALRSCCLVVEQVET